jgi:hypothetical protein
MSLDTELPLAGSTCKLEFDRTKSWLQVVWNMCRNLWTDDDDDPIQVLHPIFCQQPASVIECFLNHKFNQCCLQPREHPGCPHLFSYLRYGHGFADWAKSIRKDIAAPESLAGSNVEKNRWHERFGRRIRNTNNRPEHANSGKF